MAESNSTILELKHLSFAYKNRDEGRQVIRDLNLKIEQGDFVAIQGPSGSGKSTLFYLIGCLLRPSKGQIIFNKKDITTLDDERMAFFRNQNIGYVFQQFHLLARTSVLENILLPARYPSEIAKVDSKKIERAKELATLLGIYDLLDHQPNQLSGGQQQRVAIARALLQDVDLILADEPTGNLDSKSAAQVMDLFDELHRQGKTIVLITHDSQIAQRCQKVFHFKDGIIDSIEVLSKNHLPNQVTPSKEILDYRAPDSFIAQMRLTKNAIPLVFANIMRNRIKSLLTMIGVIIGVAAVLSMVSLGQFTKSRVLEGYETMGVNKFEVRGYPSWELKATDKVPGTPFNGFDWNRDLKILKSLFPEIRYISPQKEIWASQYSFNGRVLKADSGTRLNFSGVGPEFFSIINSELDIGKLLSPYHIESYSRVCVVGADVAQVLGTSNSELLDKTLSFSFEEKSFVPCKVIGVLKPKNGTNGSSHLVLLPYTTILSLGDIWNSKLYNFFASVKPGSDLEETGTKIKNFFSSRYAKSGNFDIDNNSVLLAQMKRFLNIFNILLGSIAFLSLLVGGIGIHNMMLVSVSDRLKEIGLRKAMGATDKSIRILFLAESLLLCTVAGLIGVVIGFAVCQAGILMATKLVKSLQFEWIIDPFAIFLALVSIVTVGIISGIVPALKAEKLEVIEALRSE